MDSLTTFQKLCDYYAAHGDKPHTHQHIYDELLARVESDPELTAHRDYVDAGARGTGCRMFSGLWDLVIDAMPDGFRGLETGCYLGQTITLWELLASRSGKDAMISTVSTFDGRDLNPNGADFFGLTLEHFDHWNLRHPSAMIRGDSSDPKVIEEARSLCAPLDLLYVDGGHSETVCSSDIINYAPMVKVGGLLAIDDSANRFHLPPCTKTINFFHGIESVSQTVDRLLPPLGPSKLPDGSEWEHLVVCMHIRIWRRTA